MKHYKLHFLWYSHFGWRGLERTESFGPSNAWNLSFCPDFSLTEAKRCLCLCRQESGIKVKLEGYLITKSQGLITVDTSMDKLSTFVFLPIFYSTLVARNDPYVEINFNATEIETPEEVTNVNEQEVQTDSDFNILNVATFETNALTSLSQDMQTMYEESHHSDFTLICGSEKFHVHKCVLSARSPVFARMFQHSMTEATENSMTIPDIDAFVLEQLVLFIYTGRINELSYPMARDLYSASDKYAVLQLKDNCSQFIVSSLSTSTAVEILILGDMHNDIMLKNAAISFMSNNFEDLNATEEWLRLVRERPSLGVEVLSSAMTQLKSKLQERK